jgi:hypothetical protein
MDCWVCGVTGFEAESQGLAKALFELDEGWLGGSTNGCELERVWGDEGGRSAWALRILRDCWSGSAMLNGLPQEE